MPLSDFSFDHAAYEKNQRWLEKKIKDKPEPVRVLMRRTNGSALFIASKAANIPFEALSPELYFYCQDIQTEKLTRWFESQLELASIDSDKFVKGLHKFMNDVTHYIKKENHYEEFFEFVCLCERMRLPLNRDGTNTLRRMVADLYQSIQLQAVEYLREPDKFDFTVVVCGLTTTGEVMTCKDTFWDFDIIAHELTKVVAARGVAGDENAMFEALVEIFRRRNHTVDELRLKEGAYTVKDIFEKIENTDKIFTHHHIALLPYINEYTYDIIPNAATPYDGMTAPFDLLSVRDVDTEALVTSLKKRARLLPANGMHFDISYPLVINANIVEKGLISHVFMREILHGDKMIMLYKLTLGDKSELSGYYDTTDGYLYSVLQECLIFEYYDRVKALILYLYACAVLRSGTEMEMSFSKHFALAFPSMSGLSESSIPMTMKMVGRGGQLQRTYKPEADQNRKGVRLNDERYVSELRELQGFIRRVPDGKHPSREAVELAESLGLDLAPNETYVRPFIKSVLHLREKTEEAEPPRS